jgi:hypothetical protein
MKYFYSFLLFLFFLKIHSQSNIVINGGFEHVYSGYPFNGDEYAQADDYGNNKSYWDQVEGWTYLDRPFPCVIVGTTSSDLLTGTHEGISAHFGNRYGHCLAGEYLTGKTIEALQTNHVYYIELYLYLGASLDENNSVGLRFFEDRPKLCPGANGRPKPDGVAHLTVPSNAPVGQWTRFYWIYKPPKNWDWFCLGDFANDGNDKTASVWDDVKILDLGTELCPYQWIWENTTFDNDHYVYQSSNLIYAGYDFDGVDVQGPVVIKSNSSVVFRSGGWIDLDTGFTVEPGAFFETELEGCQVDPCPWPATLANDYFFCDNLPHNIGLASAGSELFFNWSPADHLNSDSLANPLFTAPTNSIGQTTYTVTQTSVCGSFFNMLPPFYDPALVTPTSINSQVTVGWDSDPSPTPEIVLENVTTDEYDFHFNARVSDHTKEICINLLEGSTDHAYGPVCFERFSDFDNDTVSFEYNDLPYDLQTQLSACYDYTVIVTARNFCFDTTAVDSFYWDRNSVIDLTYVPNIITPPNPDGGPGNGLNDEFCIESTGADTYEFTVSNTGGPVFYGAGPIINSPQCIWDGHCQFSSSCTGTYLASGTYAFILELHHDCNADTASYSGYVVLAYDDPEEHMMLIPDSSTTAGNLENFGIIVFPNPANDQITVSLPGAPDNTFELDVIDYTGKVVFNKIPDLNTSINIKEWPQGIYLVIVRQNGQKLCEKKFLVQH